MGEMQPSLPKPTSTSNEEAPRGKVKAVGPTGPSADWPVGPTDLLLARLGRGLGPLVNGMCLGLCHVGFLLWWAL